MTNKEKEVILQMCKCDMNVSEVAREMYSHRNTIVYHLEKIKQRTKLDPLRFYDLVKLREMVNNE
jgi:carbohydrate diacid regulator